MLATGKDHDIRNDFSVNASTSTSSGALGNISTKLQCKVFKLRKLDINITYSLDDTSQRLFCVRWTRKMSFNIVCYRCIFAFAHVLAYIGYSFLYTTRHVIPSICHTTYNWWKIAFAMFRILSSTSCTENITLIDKYYF